MKEKIFAEWDKRIKKYPKLTLEQTREKYKEYKNTKDLDKKIEIKNEMITGTLYIVIDFLKNSILSKFRSSIYDLNDIINSTIYAWGETLVNGYIEKWPFSILYSRSQFYTKIASALFDSEDGPQVINEFGTTKLDFFKEFNIYLEILKNNPTNVPDKERYLEKIKEMGLYEEPYRISLGDYPSFYVDRNERKMEFFDHIIDSFDCPLEEIKIGLSNLEFLQRILLQNGYENIYNIHDERISDERSLENFEREHINKNFEKFVLDTPLLNDRQKLIIAHRYRLSGREFLSYSELAKKFGITPSRVRQIEEQAIRILELHSNLLEQFAHESKPKDIEISEDEYQKIVDAYGRTVKRVVEKYFNEYGRYPQFSSIKDDIKINNIHPVEPVVTPGGKIIIPRLKIDGIVENYDISYESKATPIRLSSGNIVDELTERVDDTMVYNIDSSKVDSRILMALRTNPYTLWQLSDELRNSKEVIDTLLGVKPGQLLATENLERLKDGTLRYLFNTKNLLRILRYDGWISNVMAKYNKYVYDRRIITKNDYINTLIEIMKTGKYDVINYIQDEDIRYDRRIICAGLKYRVVEVLNGAIDLERVMKLYKNDTEVLKDVVLLRPYIFFSKLDYDLKNSPEFLKMLVAGKIEMSSFIYSQDNSNFLYKVIYLLGKSVTTVGVKIVLNSTDKELKNLYKYLHECTSNQLFADNMFLEVVVQNNKVIELCPECLENKYITEHLDSLHIKYKKPEPPRRPVEFSLDRVKVKALNNDPFITSQTMRKNAEDFYNYVKEKNQKLPTLNEEKTHNQISVASYRSFISSRALEELLSNGYLTIDKVLDLDDITLKAKFGNSSSYNDIKNFVELMRCKYLRVYPVSAESFKNMANVGIEALCDILPFSDELKKFLIYRNVANSFERLIEIGAKVKMNLMNIGLPPELKKEFLFKCEILADYCYNTRVNN